ncbi:hypothetical protein QYM36_016837 [Artemia franciscana]|uniref:Reverse transcriptase domain-containing protein n=1 Tax=Artemia franciscana TaxID=6661 RepID=A0AA88H4B4_ARTSF|nr:hypothetical protein QYM36_016837 [Artemia franciscana]
MISLRKIYKHCPETTAKQLHGISEENGEPALSQRIGRHQLFSLFARKLIKLSSERYNLPLVMIFPDVVSGFVSITRQKAFKFLEKDGMPLSSVYLLKAYCKECVSRVQVYGEGTEDFTVEFGIKQGCILPPTLFNFCIDWVLENPLSSHPGVQIGRNLSLGELENVDYVGILSDPKTSQTVLHYVLTCADRIRLKVSTGKTKFMAENHTDPISLTVNKIQLDHLDSFTYLGSQLCTDKSSDTNVQQQLQKSEIVTNSLRKP